MSDETENYWLEEARGEGPTSATRRGIASVILSVFGGAATLVATLFDSIGEVVGLLGDLRDFGSELIFDGPSLILRRGAEITGSELQALGLFAFVGAVAMVALAWMIWNRLDPEIPLIDQLLPWR